MPKSIDHTIEELLDRSSMQTPDADRNLRRSIDVRCRSYALVLSLRENKTAPADSSVLMILKADGFDRCLVRIDTEGTHRMRLYPRGEYLRLNGPHVHVINELVPGKDDWYACRCDIRSLDEATRTMIRLFNIDSLSESREED